MAQTHAQPLLAPMRSSSNNGALRPSFLVIVRSAQRTSRRGLDFGGNCLRLLDDRNRLTWRHALHGVNPPARDDLSQLPCLSGAASGTGFSAFDCSARVAHGEGSGRTPVPRGGDEWRDELRTIPRGKPGCASDDSNETGGRLACPSLSVANWGEMPSPRSGLSRPSRSQGKGSPPLSIATTSRPSLIAARTPGPAMTPTTPGSSPRSASWRTAGPRPRAW